MSSVRNLGSGDRHAATARAGECSQEACGSQVAQPRCFISLNSMTSGSTSPERTEHVAYMSETRKFGNCFSNNTYIE